MYTPLPLSMAFIFSSRFLHLASSSLHMLANTAGETWHSPAQTTVKYSNFATRQSFAIVILSNIYMLQHKSIRILYTQWWQQYKSASYNASVMWSVQETYASKCWNGIEWKWKPGQPTLSMRMWTRRRWQYADLVTLNIFSHCLFSFSLLHFIGSTVITKM